MKNHVLYSVFLLLVFGACNDKDDTLPLSYMDGTYELMSENTDNGLWFGRQLIFHADGSFERQSVVRESERGENLGFVDYVTGTYQLRGEEYQEFHEEVNRINYEEQDVIYVTTKEELSAIHDFRREGEVGVLRRMENGARIAIAFPCNDIIGAASMCIGEQIFTRVN